MLTQRMQIQALADRLAGLDTTINPQQLTDPWRACWLALDQALPGKEHLALLDALAQFPDRDQIMGAIFATRPGAPLGDYPSLRQLAETLRPIEWLWPGWIPRGMITLLGAVPGAGKSFVALAITRCLLHNQPFPNGSIPTPRNRVEDPTIIYVDAEAAPQLTNERANAWNLDTDRLFLMLPDLTSVDDSIIDFIQSRHRNRLVEMIAELRPELVILDSLSSLSSKGQNNVEDVNALFAFLNLLAMENNIGLVLIHHMRKSRAGQGKLSELDMDDFRGSGHIIAMSRSVIGLSVVQTSTEFDRNSPRKMEIIKTNLGPYPKPLGFEFVPLTPDVPDLQWVDTPRPYIEPTQQDDCKDWLQDLLESGEMRPADIIKLGKEEGFSRAMIYRAREALGKNIENTEGRRHPLNAWRWTDT